MRGARAWLQAGLCTPSWPACSCKAQGYMPGLAARGAPIIGASRILCDPRCLLPVFDATLMHATAVRGGGLGSPCRPAGMKCSWSGEGNVQSHRIACR